MDFGQCPVFNSIFHPAKCSATVFIVHPSRMPMGDNNNFSKKIVDPSDGIKIFSVI